MLMKLTTVELLEERENPSANVNKIGHKHTIRAIINNWHDLLKKLFFGVHHLDTCIFLIFYNEPELGAEIDPGMALTPLPSSIG